MFGRRRFDCALQSTGFALFGRYLEKYTNCSVTLGGENVKSQ